MNSNRFIDLHRMILTTSGICNNDDNSSWSWTEVFGCTMPPWLLSTVYDPTKTLLATVWRNTSTFKTSPMISSVSYFFFFEINPKYSEMKWLMAFIKQSNKTKLLCIQLDRCKVNNSIAVRNFKFEHSTLSKSGCTKAT